MVHECKACNYKTDRGYDYKKHTKTDKHLQKVKAMEIAMKEQKKIDATKIICSYCKTRFKYSRNLVKHMKKCSIYNDLYDKYTELQENNKVIVEKYENLLERFDVKRDEFEEVLIDNLVSSTGKNPRIFSFVEGNYTETLPLEEIKAEDVPKLNFLADILKKKNGKIEMCNVLQHHSLHKTLKDFVGDILIPIYKKDDKKTQQFFVTDCSRLNYLIRDIVNKSPVWRKDSKGIILAKKIIKPILNFIRDHLCDMIHKYLQYTLTIFPKDKMESVDRNRRLISIISAIENGSLEHSILKYLAPHFILDKSFVDQFDKDEYLVHFPVKKKKKRLKKDTKGKSKKVTFEDYLENISEDFINDQSIKKSKKNKLKKNTKKRSKYSRKN